VLCILIGDCIVSLANVVQMKGLSFDQLKTLFWLMHADMKIVATAQGVQTSELVPATMLGQAPERFMYVFKTSLPRLAQLKNSTANRPGDSDDDDDQPNKRPRVHTTFGRPAACDH
jgi:hypothetical protein